jgi:hypothetical protein
VFFGKVPDRLSLLQRAYYDRPNGIVQTPVQGPADLVSKWTLYNQNQNSGSNVPTASFGTNTLAPDGTNNGVKLVETASNTIHAAVSVFQTGNGFGNFQLRLSVFAKAAEHTRFVLSINDTRIDAGLPAGPGLGCTTVFDLAGGQIGVVNTAYGGGSIPFVAKGQEIVSFGNGWYRCTMDVQVGQGVANFYGFTIELDNGSGTAAQSTSYTGDGASGVYFWRSTCLPPAAWGLSTVTFFDDFTTLNTIDLSNTQAPGFNWYVDPNWPNYLTGLSVTNASNYSIIGGTILKQDATVGGVNFVLPMSAVSLGGANYNASFLAKPPALLEASIATQAIFPGQLSWWTHSLAFLLSANPPLGWHIEDDWFEYPPGGSALPRNTFAAAQDNVEGLYDAFVGYTKWDAINLFPGATPVSYLGTVYNTATPPTLGVAPPGSSWVAINPQPQSYTEVDWTQQHVTSTLWLPDQGIGNAGQVLSFFDGAFVPLGHFIYGRRIFNVPGPGVPSPLPVYFFTGDYLPGPLIMQTNGGVTTYWDFVRVTQ